MNKPIQKSFCDLEKKDYEMTLKERKNAFGIQRGSLLIDLIAIIITPLIIRISLAITVGLYKCTACTPV